MLRTVISPSGPQGGGRYQGRHPSARPPGKLGVRGVHADITVSMDLSSMTKEELDVLRHDLQEEEVKRTCTEWLRHGGQACDQGPKQHTEHGYTTWNGNVQVRITWRPVDATQAAEAR